VEDVVRISVTKEHVVVDISIQEDEGGGWIETEGWLSRIAPLRQDLMRGDYRMLYLAWLRAIQPLGGVEADDERFQYLEIRLDQLEPPVPAGLDRLTPPLKSFVKLFEIDEDLLAAAAEASAAKSAAPELDIEKLIAGLPERERNEFLLRLASGETNLDIILLNRLKEVSSRGGADAGQKEGQRRISYILEEADERSRQRRERKRREAERARIRALESLAAKEPELWQQVTALIERKQPKTYDEAVKILIDLGDVAAHFRRQDSFQSRINQIQKDYSKRPGLLSRMRNAGLDKQ
jgi:hypothetical protein